MKQELLHKKVEDTILDSYDALYRLVFTYVRNEEDAMDIVQESVYKAIKRADDVKEEQYIRTWLYRITINTALDFIRKKQREVLPGELPEQGAEDTYQDFDTIQALDILEEKEKAIIVLRFFEDRKLKEVAEILNENISTVKTSLYRSLGKLKIELTREAYE